MPCGCPICAYSRYQLNNTFKFDLVSPILYLYSYSYRGQRLRSHNGIERYCQHCFPYYLDLCEYLLQEAPTTQSNLQPQRCFRCKLWCWRLQRFPFRPCFLGLAFSVKKKQFAQTVYHLCLDLKGWNNYPPGIATVCTVFYLVSYYFLVIEGFKAYRAFVPDDEVTILSIVLKTTKFWCVIQDAHLDIEPDDNSNGFRTAYKKLLGVTSTEAEKNNKEEAQAALAAKIADIQEAK